jgi:thioredoxin-like negative regulator of GroEL
MGNVLPRWWADSPNIRNLSDPTELLSMLDTANPESLLVVCFYNEDCYSCRSLHPKLQSIAAATSKAGVNFVKINGSNPIWQSYCQNHFNISTVPYFHFYKQGKRVSEMSASLNPQRLAAFRAEIEIQRGAHGQIIFGEA